LQQFWRFRTGDSGQEIQDRRFRTRRFRTGDSGQEIQDRRFRTDEITPQEIQDRKL
jgi:hypothetical protein